MFKNFFVITIVLVGLVACQEQNSTSFQDVYSDYERFQLNGSFFTQEELYQAIQDGIIGGTAGQAIVPLVFGDDGNLLDSTEFNQMLGSDQLADLQYPIAYTDFSTYRDILLNASDISTLSIDPQYLSEEYVWGMSNFAVQGVPLEAQSDVATDNQSVFAFDPYETKHQTYEEVMAEIEERTKLYAEQYAHLDEPIAELDLDAGTELMDLETQDFYDSDYRCTNNLAVSDIVVRSKNSLGVRDFAGHTAAIESTATGYLTGGNSCDRRVRTIEATGYHGNIFTPDPRDIAVRSILTGFDPKRQRWVAYARMPRITNYQRRRVREFHRAMDRRNDYGDLRYHVVFGARNENPYQIKAMHCSLLNWFAYKYMVGVDIDGNGGVIVKPYDLVIGSSPLFIYHQVSN